MLPAIHDFRSTYQIDPGMEPRVPSSTAAEIDTEVCDSATCPHCGHIGLNYWPFVNPHTREYRAFAKCPVCRHIEEF